MPDAPPRDHWLGFDLGGTKMLATVFDAQFRPVAQKRKKTRGYEGVDVGLARVALTIRKALERAELTVDRLAGIGVGVPGPIDLETGVVLIAPNLQWRDAPVRTFLEKEFDCPVVVANDVDVGVYGEYRFGAGRGGRTVLGIFPGTGIGGGCVYEGRILRGRTSTAMEIGHVRVAAEGPRCGCGQIGCLEAMASRLAIAGECAKAAYRGSAPNLMKLAGTDLANIRSGALKEAIQKGDTAIEEIVRRAAWHIGVATASVVHLLAPDVIVLGGGLVEAMPDLFVPTVQHAAESHVLANFVGTFHVKVTELGDSAGAIGAAAWAAQALADEAAATAG
jgi:glucokinase